MPPWAWHWPGTSAEAWCRSFQYRLSQFGDHLNVVFSEPSPLMDRRMSQRLAVARHQGRSDSLWGEGNLAKANSCGVKDCIGNGCRDRPLCALAHTQIG